MLSNSPGLRHPLGRTPRDPCAGPMQPMQRRALADKPGTPAAPDWRSVRIFRSPSGLKLPAVGFHGSPVEPSKIFGEGACGLTAADRNPAIALSDPRVFKAAMNQHLEPVDDAFDLALRNDEPHYGRQFVSISKACWVADEFAIDKMAEGECGYRYLIDLQALSAAGHRITDVNREHGRLFSSEEEIAAIEVPSAFVVGAIPVRREGNTFQPRGVPLKDQFIPNPDYRGCVNVFSDEL